MNRRRNISIVLLLLLFVFGIRAFAFNTREEEPIGVGTENQREEEIIEDDNTQNELEEEILEVLDENVVDQVVLLEEEVEVPTEEQVDILPLQYTITETLLDDNTVLVILKANKRLANMNGFTYNEETDDYRTIFSENGVHIIVITDEDNQTEEAEVIINGIDDVAPIARFVTPATDYELHKDNPLIEVEVDESEENLVRHWFEITNPDDSLSYIMKNTTELKYAFNLDTSKGSGVYKIRYVATDKFGNRSDDPNFTNNTIRYINIDNETPKLIISAVTESGNLFTGRNYVNETVYVTLHGTDNLTNPENLRFERKVGGVWTAIDGNTLTFEGPNTHHTLWTRVIDEAGNIYEAPHFTIKVDKTAPRTPKINTNGYVLGTISEYDVKLTAYGSRDVNNDDAWLANESRSKYQHKVNDGEWIDSKEVTLTEDGDYIVTFRVVDEAGNISDSSSALVQIDKRLLEYKRLALGYINEIDFVSYVANHNVVDLFINIPHTETNYNFEGIYPAKFMEALFLGQNPFDPETNVTLNSLKINEEVVDLNNILNKFPLAEIIQNEQMVKTYELNVVYKGKALTFIGSVNIKILTPDVSEVSFNTPAYDYDNQIVTVSNLTSGTPGPIQLKYVWTPTRIHIELKNGELLDLLIDAGSPDSTGKYYIPMPNQDDGKLTLHVYARDAAGTTKVWGGY